MTGGDVRAVFAPMLPQEAMHRLCQPCGVSERQRQWNLGRVVRAMVMSAGTPGGASQADVWRASLESAVPRVTRAACSRWGDAPRERFMEARAQPVELPGPRRGVQAWSIVDATTLKVRDALSEDCPQDAPAGLADGLDHRRRSGAHAPSYHPSATSRSAPDGGAAAHEAPRLATGRVLPVHGPGLRAAGNGGQAALGQER